MCYWGARGAEPFTGLTRLVGGLGVTWGLTHAGGRPSGSRSLAGAPLPVGSRRALAQLSVVNQRRPAAYVRDPVRDDQSSSVLRGDVT
jgi:hypothetical protein